MYITLYLCSMQLTAIYIPLSPNDKFINQYIYHENLEIILLK